jgi:hypothetical protein
MRTKRLAGVALMGLCVAWAAVAAPNAVVDAVQAPAWIERAERRLPLAPGMVLENRDRVLTGAGARAIVQLADGSAVKLGENANVAVNALGRTQAGVFTGALDVLKGAFRLTTQVFRKLQGERAINIRAGTVTIGIRGTDLWGRANDEKDLVCLIEGRINVSHPLGEPTELNEPLQFYGAEKGKAPGVVARVNPEQLAQWSTETELREGVPTQRSGGEWSLGFGRLDQAAALDLRDRLAGVGYAAKIRPVRVSGGHLYELRLGQLVTEREAHALAERLVGDLHVPMPAILRR